MEETLSTDTNSHSTALLSYLAITVPEPEKAATFYVDVLGMTAESRDGGGVALSWGSGSDVILLEPGARAGVDRFGFEVPDAGQLAALTDRLRSAGLDGGWDHPGEPGGPGAVRVLDPRGRRLELHGRIDRAGERAETAGQRPIRLQHVTFETTDMESTVAFYEKVVGFRVSDRMADGFTWLRSDTFHHLIAFVSGPSDDVDHFSFDVLDWPELKEWCDALGRRGVSLLWGPGRHGPGNNLFVIFPDPNGLKIELSAEMEQYWDDRAEYQPRVWQPVATTLNLWGPLPSWRDVETDEGPAGAGAPI